MTNHKTLERAKAVKLGLYRFNVGLVDVIIGLVYVPGLVLVLLGEPASPDLYTSPLTVVPANTHAQ